MYLIFKIDLLMALQARYFRIQTAGRYPSIFVAPVFLKLSGHSFRGAMYNCPMKPCYAMEYVAILQKSFHYHQYSEGTFAHP
jgi:hypothetical protein